MIKENVRQLLRDNDEPSQYIDLVDHTIRRGNPPIRERHLEDIAIDESKDEGFLPEQSENAAAMRLMNEDKIDPQTKMSSIDFAARLSGDQIKGIIIIDELVRLSVLPADTGVTRQIKRLSVSLAGAGRAEQIQLVSGMREAKNGLGGTGFVQGFKNMLGIGGQR